MHTDLPARPSDIGGGFRAVRGLPPRGPHVMTMAHCCSNYSSFYGSMRGENPRVILRAKKFRNAEESTPRDMRLVFGAPTTDRPLAS